MVGQIDLPFWPSTIDCLSWSKDNLIAVAGGDSIAILTPRLHEPGSNDSRWNRTHFKANAFTEREVPITEPLSFKSYSVGEELSQRYVQALAWSSPGLGRHGRCLLAALSSNHVLSIWECNGKLDVSADWKRTVIVNHALRKHYSQLNLFTGETQHVVDELKQKSQRVRAFAWSPPVYKEWAPSDESTPFTDYGQQFLAVSTEAEDILLLRVISPHSMLTRDTEWRVEVTSGFNSGGLAIGAIAEGCTDEADAEALWQSKEVYIADHIAWGPTRKNEHHDRRSAFAFISKGRLFCATVEGCPSHVDTAASLVDTECRNLLPNHSDLTGPLKFIPDAQSLIVFGQDKVFCVDTYADPRDEQSYTTHHLDDRWDEVSGVAFSRSSSITSQIHMASLLSSSSTSTTTLSLPLRSDEISPEPAWQRALRDVRNAFSDQHKLNGYVLDRVWGIAASPMGDFVATAATLLPSNAVTYLAPYDHRCKITITRQEDGEHIILPFAGGTSPSSDISSATLLFGLKAYVEQYGPVDCAKLSNAISKCVDVPDDQIDWDLDIPIEQGMEPVQHVRYLRLRVLLLPEMRTIRHKLLARIALDRTHADSVSKPVVQQLVTEVLKIPSRFSTAGVLSHKIYSAYTTLSTKLQSPTDRPPLSIEWGEECRICQEAIPFESVKWARCKKGHQFVRCALTFLAMQQPGISKACGICGTQYLDEWGLPGFKWSKEEDVEMTEIPEDQTEPPDDSIVAGGWVQVGRVGVIEPASSLARILFAAFDRCVYCGGSF